MRAAHSAAAPDRGVAGILQDADDEALAAHGRTPWSWLEDVTKPVLLTTGTEPA